MVEKLRLGRRLAVGAAVIFGVLFAVVGQGAHRAAAIGLDASVVSIIGSPSPDVPEGSPQPSLRRSRPQLPATST